MKISQRNDEGHYTLTLEGDITTSTSDQLHDALAAVPDSAEKLTLDFRDVTMITSAGLREVTICFQRFPEDRLELVNVNPRIMETIRITGMDSFLNIREIGEEFPTFVNLSFEMLLKYRAEKTGDRVAVKNERERYTWSEVDKLSQIVANDLAEKGVRQGSRVGICGSNSLNWIITFFAVQKLNAVAILMNPSQTAEEIGGICAIGDVAALCYGEIPAMKEEKRFLSAVRGAGGTAPERFYSFRNDVCLRDRMAEYEALKGKFEDEVNPDFPCTVIFTSGSTGRPKGVILSSYNLLNAAAVQVRMQKVTGKDECLLIVPLFHILGLVVCFLPCALTGAELFIPDDIRTDTLIRVMEKEQCTLMHSVPTMIIAILNNRNFRPEIFASLRCTLLAGAAATEAQLKMFRQKMPGNHFMIAYGLSEMAPVSETLYDDTEEHRLRTVGRPVENISVRIRNRETGEPCATGEKGEILVRGFNLMTGYYKIPPQEQGFDADGWLHTGDMGYLDEEGYLIFAGRYKELIIRGGENIMPGEVENAVSGLACVDSVKVIGVPSDFYGEEVCVCMKLKKGAVFDEDRAKAELREKLAKYKIPARFVILDEFPMLGSGKIDTAALKQRVAGKG